MTSTSVPAEVVTPALEGAAALRSLGRRVRRHPLRLTVAADLVAAAGALALTELAGGRPTSGTAVVVTTVWFGLMLSSRAYEPMPSGFSELRGRSVVRAGAGLGLACWFATAASPGMATSGQLAVLTAAVTALALGHRLLVRSLRIALRTPHPPTRVLVAGDPDDVGRVVAELRRSRTSLWDVVGVCLTRVPDGDAADFATPVRIDVSDLDAAVFETGAEAAVVVPCRGLDPATLRRLSWQLERRGVHLFHGTGMLDVAASRATLVNGGDLGLLHVRPVLHSGPGHRLKALAERLAAGVALLLLAPLLLALVAAVRLDSPGGAVFRQTRVGERGREFTMYKLRTMSVGADRDVVALGTLNEADDVLFKIRADPRVTRLGRHLRRYSLDEMPQLVNVLRGDMALVGPRPALPTEVARYDDDSRRRLAVRPGLTGLWQVSGRSDLTWEDTVRLDLHYVDNWSFLLDAGIVLRTVGAVLGHRGAY